MIVTRRWPQTEGRGINSAQGLFDADELAYSTCNDIHTEYDQRLTALAATDAARGRA